jgi:hypothetical protein
MKTLTPTLDLEILLMYDVDGHSHSGTAQTSQRKVSRIKSNRDQIEGRKMGMTEGIT